MGEEANSLTVPTRKACWTVSLQSVTVGVAESVVRLRFEFVKYEPEPSTSIAVAFSFTEFQDFKIPHWFFPKTDPRDISPHMVMRTLDAFFTKVPFRILQDPLPPRDEDYHSLPPAMRALHDDLRAQTFTSTINPSPFEEDMPDELPDAPAGVSGQLDRDALRREFGHGSEDQDADDAAGA